MQTAAPDLLDVDDTRLLVELGFTALTGGDTALATTLFEGARAARPREEAGALGLAMVALAEARVGEAEAILRALPPSDAASLYLGLALMQGSDREGGELLLRDVAAFASDPAFRAMAAASFP